MISDLCMLYPNEQADKLRKEFYVKKLNFLLLFLVAGIIFAFLAKVSWKLQSTVTDGIVIRNEYANGTKKLTLEAKRKDTADTFEMDISPRILSEGEVNELAEKFYQNAGMYILGENQNYGEVYTNMNLCESYENFPFSYAWESDKPSVLNNLGEVSEVSRETEVHITGVLSYEMYSYSYVFTIVVVPIKRTAEELEHIEILKMLTESEENGREEKDIYLPTEWNDGKITWRYVVADYSLFILMVVPVIAVILFTLSDSDLHRQLKQRQKSMLEDYSDIVHKLALYIGAGMTIRGAIQKIGRDFEQNGAGKLEVGKYQGIRKLIGKREVSNYGYREVLRTCRELQTGISERTAYERWGKRTGLKEYIKLSALLTQNLKHGNSTFKDALAEEFRLSLDAKLMHTRKLGEEAGTKLLFPMVLMLGIAMVLVLIPAFGVL